MPFIRTPRLAIYCEQAGRGEDLLFISGTGGDLRNKPNQFDSPLAAEFKLTSFDQRGLGQTENPAGAFSMAQYADDAAALLDALELDRVKIIGVSFGGMVAQELMLRHPERVRAAVLACTSSGGAGGQSYPLHEFADLSDHERAEAHLKVADTRHTDAWIGEHPDAWQKRLALALANQRQDRDIDGARKQLAARAQHDTFDRLPGISVPVLLAAGRYDGIAPIENMQAMAAELPRATLEIFSGGHMFLIQDKTAYSYIIQWLKSVS